MQYVRKLSKGDKVAVVSLLRDIVGNIPVDRSLLESDAPFTKGLSEKQTVNVNDLIYKYIDELYYLEIVLVCSASVILTSQAIQKKHSIEFHFWQGRKGQQSIAVKGFYDNYLTYCTMQS